MFFELREGADVMDAALVVERRHRFGPHDLAARGADRGKRHVSVDHAKRRPDHVTAFVDLGHDAVGPVRPVGSDRQAGPLGRRVTARDVPYSDLPRARAQWPPSGTDDYASEAAATAIVNIHPITARKTEKMIPMSDFLYFMMLDS